MPEHVDTFVVARNPDEASSLPYLVWFPLPGDALIVKAADTWPRLAKVYCHRAESWPEQPEILSEVPVRSCRRRGVAIDLVLDRARENRSQLVFKTLRSGREAIFWQSARTTAKARPGVRVPTRRASRLKELEVLVDTRERYPYRFAKQQVITTRRAMPAGDYGVEFFGDIVAAVERKTLSDLAGSLVDGNLTYVLAELASLPRAALVVEDRYADVFKLTFVAPRLRRRSPGDRAGPLPERADRVLRHAPAGRGMGIPLPRRGPRLPHCRTPSRGGQPVTTACSRAVKGGRHGRPAGTGAERRPLTARKRRGCTMEAVPPVGGTWKPPSSAAQKSRRTQPVAATPGCWRERR